MANIDINTIRRMHVGEPPEYRQSLGAGMRPSTEAQVTEASGEIASVLGGSGSGKDDVVNAGDLRGEDIRATGCSAEVRVAIVASNPGNSGGAKGDRKANASKEGSGETPPPSVPERDKQGGEARKEPPVRDYGAERRVWTEKMLASLHQGGKGRKWFSLIDKVSRLDVLQLAWEKVQSNAGACGVDGTTVARFAKDSQSRLLAVKEHLDRGVYQPQPVKRAWITKLGSPEKRPLGIPTVRDRVVQTALKMVIEPILEREFAEHSYGFRPGRSCHDALRQVESLLKSGHVHVVDLDIKGYFDAIPHKELMERVGEHIADGQVLTLIRAFLQQGVLEGWQTSEPESGTPQGGVISPLLANLYLNPLDWLLAAAGLEAVRYADDMVVLCKDRSKAERALERIRCWMKEAGLELHPEKTRVVDMSETGSYLDFLGYRFWRGRYGRLRRFIRPKSKKKLREELKPKTRRASGWGLSTIIERINPILRGWFGYFQQAAVEELRVMDGWVRSRLRGMLRAQHKRRGRGRGRDHQRWNNRYFLEQGLFSLEEARAQVFVSLRREVTR